jgi:hypothetical protein
MCLEGSTRQGMAIIHPTERSSSPPDIPTARVRHGRHVRRSGGGNLQGIKGRAAGAVRQSYAGGSSSPPLGMGCKTETHFAAHLSHRSFPTCQKLGGVYWLSFYTLFNARRREGKEAYTHRRKNDRFHHFPNAYATAPWVAVVVIRCKAIAASPSYTTRTSLLRGR